MLAISKWCFGLMGIVFASSAFAQAEGPLNGTWRGEMEAKNEFCYFSVVPMIITIQGNTLSLYTHDGKEDREVHAEIEGNTFTIFTQETWYNAAEKANLRRQRFSISGEITRDSVFGNVFATKMLHRCYAHFSLRPGR